LGRRAAAGADNQEAPNTQHLLNRLARDAKLRATARRLRPSTSTARRTRPYISTWNIPPVSHKPPFQQWLTKQVPAVVYFYSAAKHRSRGVLWSIFAPALITRGMDRRCLGRSHTCAGDCNVALDKEVFLQQQFFLRWESLAGNCTQHLWWKLFLIRWMASNFAVLSITSALLLAALPITFRLRIRYIDRPIESPLGRCLGLKRAEQWFFFAPVVLITIMIAVKMNPGM